MLNLGSKIYLAIYNPKYKGTHCEYCGQPYKEPESRYKLVEGYFIAIRSDDGYEVELIAEYDEFKPNYKSNKVVFGHTYLEEKDMKNLMSLSLSDFESYDEGPYAFINKEDAEKWMEEFGNE